MMLRSLRSENGASLVESALVLPLILFLLFGVIDSARLISTHNAVRTASREAARHGSAVGTNGIGDPHYVDCPAIRDAGMWLSESIELLPANITIEYDSGPATVVKDTCPVGGPAPDPGDLGNGDRILVTTSYGFEPITPIIGDILGSLTVTSVDRRTILSP
ncbi:MAG: TadE/TadG family type IV pilus assembly protein [Acidimicrobiia bacterium]|nr:TadE/TadG family type IV pilus assembly protein [Acidimicrobiia bacterium]